MCVGGKGDERLGQGDRLRLGERSSYLLSLPAYSYEYLVIIVQLANHLQVFQIR